MIILLALQLLACLHHRLKPALLAVVSLAASLSGTAQIAKPTPPTPLPQAPAPRHRLREHLYPYVGTFCGVGGTTSSQATLPTAGCGAGFTLLPFPIPLYTEVGVMGPQANRSYLSGYVSVDASIPLAKTTSTYLAVALVGYSRLFETGHALDYGVALILPRPWKPDADMRLELRDYYTFANPTQHNVMLRIGLIAFEAD